MALRAVYGVANPRNSAAIAAVLRLVSHPAKTLARREEIVNMLLGNRSGAEDELRTPVSASRACPDLSRMGNAIVIAAYAYTAMVSGINTSEIQ